MHMHKKGDKVLFHHFCRNRPPRCFLLLIHTCTHQPLSLQFGVKFTWIGWTALSNYLHAPLQTHKHNLLVVMAGLWAHLPLTWAAVRSLSPSAPSRGPPHYSVSIAKGRVQQHFLPEQLGFSHFLPVVIDYSFTQPFYLYSSSSVLGNIQDVQMQGHGERNLKRQSVTHPL